MRVNKEKILMHTLPPTGFGSLRLAPPSSWNSAASRGSACPVRGCPLPTQERGSVDERRAGETLTLTRLADRQAGQNLARVGTSTSQHPLNFPLCSFQPFLKFREKKMVRKRCNIEGDVFLCLPTPTKCWPIAGVSISTPFSDVTNYKPYISHTNPKQVNLPASRHQSHLVSLSPSSL